MDEKPIFFARKFEPVVNQDIINSVDTYLFGYSNQGKVTKEQSCLPDIMLDMILFSIDYNFD